MFSKSLAPRWSLQAAERRPWALGVLWEQAVGQAPREGGWELPASRIPPFPAPGHGAMWAAALLAEQRSRAGGAQGTPGPPLWAQAATSFGSSCTEPSCIAASEASNVPFWTSGPVTQPAYPPTASLGFRAHIQRSAWNMFWALCWHLKVSIPHFFSLLLNPLSYCPFYPAMVPFCPGCPCTFVSRRFLSVRCPSAELICMCGRAGTSQICSGCVCRGSPGAPVARAAHMIHRLLQRDPKELMNPSNRQK